MGAWGPKIFEDDTACDLREEFAELLAEGRTPEDATCELERRYEPETDEIDIEPVFWIALAATQHDWGRLEPQVRNKAVAIIDSGRDLERFFEDAKIREKRRKVLDELKAKLLGPPRPLRQIKPRTRIFTPWILDQVVRYRLTSGKSCLFRVVGHKEDKGGRYAIFEVLSEEGGESVSALKVALTPGLRGRDGKMQRIIVPTGLEASPRISATQLGRSALAPIMRKLRKTPRLPGHWVMSIMTVEKLDLNLKTDFGLA